MVRTTGNPDSRKKYAKMSSDIEQMEKSKREGDTRGYTKGTYRVLSFKKVFGPIEGYGNGQQGTEIDYIEDGKIGHTFKIAKNVYKDEQGKYHHY
jgi:hypothetical protein